MKNSRCSIVTNIGKWVIVHGAGCYENIRGGGLVNMVPTQKMAIGTVRWKLNNL